MQLKLGDISTIKIKNHAWCFAAKNIGGSSHLWWQILIDYIHTLVG